MEGEATARPGRPAPPEADRPVERERRLQTLEEQLAVRGDRIRSLREENRRLRAERDRAVAELGRTPSRRIRRAVHGLAALGPLRRWPTLAVERARRAYRRSLRRLGRR
jgi:hypothetical protein